MSQRMRCLPSDLLKISHPITAFYFDRAVWMFGGSVQSEMDAVESGTKNHKSVPARKKMVLNKWIPAKTPHEKGRFRDPAVAVGGR